MIIVIALAAVLSSDPPTESWDALVKSGIELRESGRIAEAKEKFEQARQVSERLESNDLRRWMSLNQLGIIAHIEGRFDAAIAFYQAAARGYGVPGEASRVSILVEILANLANSLRQTGRIKEAAAVLQRAQTLESSLLPPGQHSENVSHGLGWIAVEEGRFADATQLFESELKAVERRKGTPLQLAAVLGSLGYAAHKRGQYEEAETFYRRTMELRRKAWPAAQPELYRTMSSLAMVLGEAGKYERARNLLRETLAAMEAAPPPNPTDVAACTTNLAVILLELNRHKEAEPFARRAIAIYEDQGQGQSKAALMTMQTLALILMRSKQGDRAEELMRQIIASWRQRDPDHPDQVRVLHNLAVLYTRQRRYAEAEHLFQTAIHIVETKLGPTHRDLVTLVSSHARLLKAMKRGKEAAAMKKRADALAMSTRGNVGAAVIDHLEMTIK